MHCNNVQLPLWDATQASSSIDIRLTLMRSTRYTKFNDKERGVEGRGGGKTIIKGRGRRREREQSEREGKEREREKRKEEREGGAEEMCSRNFQLF